VKSAARVTRTERAHLAGAGKSVTFAVRPEDLSLASEAEGIPVTVDVVEELGADAYVYGSTDLHGEVKPIIARVDGRRPPMKGETVHFAPKQGHVHVFNIETGERIGD